MTDEFSDTRPRRRLFGRRRPDEEVADASTPPPSTAPEGEPEREALAEGATSSLEAEPEPERGEIPPPEPEPVPVPAPPPQPQPGPEPGPDPRPEPEPAPVPEPPAPVVVQDAPPPQAVAEAPREPSATPPPEPEREETVFEDNGGQDTGPHGVLQIPRIIAIANQKGGVGKTTTAVNLGAALAEGGLRVLVVDLDPQGNASTGLGINPRDVNASIYEVLMQDTPALDAVEPTSLKNLFVIPATLDLAGAEIELVPAFSRELKLKRALETVRSEYDVVLIDCPPSLGLLTVNGLAAADDVIVPIQCEYYALEGLGQLLRNVALVRSSLNASLDVRGIILTMYDARTRLAEQVETEVREHFGDKVYKTVVPRTVRLAEAPSFGQPVIVFDPTSRGASAYRDLAKEVSGGATRRTG